jgi:hypothetical protein
MDIRTTWSKISFPRAFVLPGSDVEFTPGDYDLVIEEERLLGLSFSAFRRTSAFLQVHPDPRFPDRTELRPVTDADLQQALGHAPALDIETTTNTKADTAPRKEQQ